MLTEEHRDRINGLISSMEHWADACLKHATPENQPAAERRATKLRGMAQKLRGFEGGYWFSAYCDMNSPFVSERENDFILRDHETETGEPEELFRYIVNKAEIPIVMPPDYGHKSR